MVTELSLEMKVFAMDLCSQHGYYLQVSLLTGLVYLFLQDLNSVYCTGYNPARF